MSLLASIGGFTRARRLCSLLALAAILPLGGVVAGPQAPAALGATPQTSVADVEDEVMCPICGTLLELANSPQAQRQRAFIARLIAAGETKEEIKDQLVAQYGDEALAVPPKSGFDLSAYLVPIIAFLVALGALAVSVMRWRRRAKPPEEKAPPTDTPRGEEAERLETDIARYDL